MRNSLAICLIIVCLLAVGFMWFETNLDKQVASNKEVMVQCISGSGQPIYIGLAKNVKMHNGITEFVDVKRAAKIKTTMECMIVEPLN